MRAVDSGRTARRSRRWIRSAVNNYPDILNGEISAASRRGPSEIEWASPLAGDEYAEYGDQDFLDRVGVTFPNRALADFWPNRGPQWDTLGCTGDGRVLLVEAKASIPEAVSPGTGASDVSLRLIEQSLTETKRFLGVDPSIPWSGKLYQYANGLGHLYLLRELNSIPAFLVFVYFLGDEDMKRPESVAEWKAALTVVKRVLGLGERHPMAKYVADVFIHVRTLDSI